MQRWPHQIKTCAEFWALYDAGKRRICITAPPRAGKTVMLVDIINQATKRNLRSLVYTHRIMLTDQMSNVFNEFYVDHGVRAANWEDIYLSRDVQIASIHTDLSRVLKRKKWSLHDAQLVFVDEAHLNRGKGAQALLSQYIKRGACIVGLTATPVGIGHLYQDLIVSCTNSDLRACGAHVPCLSYAPSEPDTNYLRKVRRQIKTGEYSPKAMAKIMATDAVFGRVIDHWRRLNPNQRPTILFAPSVASSVWFAQQFEKAGIKAAHIDGGSIYVDGESYDSDLPARREIMDRSRDGDIKVICNRFVLREAIDAPWLAHGIGATVFGAEHTYVQAGSRILTSHPGLVAVTWQDHGGNWWRHGSLNEDREWRLTDDWRAPSKRRKRPPKGQPSEGIRCPKCSALRRGGMQCPNCKYRHKLSVRVIIQLGGKLMQVRGPAHKAKRKKTNWQITKKHWDSAYYGALNSKTGNKTMNQVRTDFARRSQKEPIPFRRFGKAPWWNCPDATSVQEWDMRIKEFHKLATQRKGAWNHGNG